MSHPIEIKIEVNDKPWNPGDAIPPGATVGFSAHREGNPEAVNYNELVWHISKDGGPELSPRVFSQQYAGGHGHHTQADRKFVFGPLKADVRGLVVVRVEAKSGADLADGGAEKRYAFRIDASTDSEARELFVTKRDLDAWGERILEAIAKSGLVQ